MYKVKYSLLIVNFFIFASHLIGRLSRTSLEVQEPNYSSSFESAIRELNYNDSQNYQSLSCSVSCRSNYYSDAPKYMEHSVMGTAVSLLRRTHDVIPGEAVKDAI